MELAYRLIAVVLTGVPRLVSIFARGQREKCVHLNEWRPGSGKTSMALQFLMDALGELTRRLASMAEDER